jgi:hypothetical protein
MKRLLIALLFTCSPAVCGYGGYLLFQTVPAMAGNTSTSPYSLILNGTFSSFATVANGGKILNTTACGVNSIMCPADLIFTKDSGCTVPFAGWEIFSYSASTGQLSAAVQIPTLSSTAPVRVYACMGNAAVTTFQGGARGGAWDNHYRLGLHMEESSGTVLHDSTANGNDAVKRSATAPSATAAGMTGAAQSFQGIASSTGNDYALFTSLTAPTSTYTIEYWVNPVSFINLDSVFLQSSSGAPTVFTGFYWYPSGSSLYFNSYSSLNPPAPARAVAGKFNYVVFVRNGDTMTSYMNGAVGVPVSGFGSGAEQWKGLGWDGTTVPSGNNSFNGILDEVFFSDTARGSDYVTARFNNINNPSAFYTVSAYTPLSSSALSTITSTSQVVIF